MSASVLSTRQEGAVKYVTLNNPPINLMSVQMVKELFGLVGQLNAEPQTKVVVFDSGIADFFIAHFDLNDLNSSMDDPASKSQFDDINILQSLGLCIQSLPQVTIAKVNGVCRGGGVELILGMTMRFASASSRFCLPEACGGFLASGGGATRLALACGPARALEVLLSARDFSAQEAQDYGIINLALPVAELDSYVQSLAERIGSRSSHVIAINREVVKRAVGFALEPLFAGFDYENEALRASLGRPEMQRMSAAMLEGGQTRERELDLPSTMEQMFNSLPQT